jgi:BRCA1-associated protein
MKEKLLSLIKENSFLKQLNTQLVEDQDRWKKEIQKVQEESQKKQQTTDKQIEDLNEQLRDLMFFIEAQKTMEKKGNNAQEGQVLVVPNVIKPKTTKKKNKNKK